MLQDLLGGELLLADVTVRGEKHGHHYWNRFLDGVEIDLTRQQFGDDEQIGRPTVVTRPPGPPRRCAKQYALLRSRVFAALAGHRSPSRSR